MVGRLKYRAGPGRHERDEIRIRELAARLPAGWETRRAAEEWFSQGLVSEERIPLLIGILDHAAPKRWRERAIAACLLGRIAPESPLRKKSIATLIEALESPPDPDGTVAKVLWIFAVFPFVIPLLPVLEQGRVNLVRTLAADSLGRLRASESVDALAATLHDGRGTETTLGSAGLRGAAESALVSVLPTLTESSGRSLRPETPGLLCRGLSRRDELAAMAILAALERIGGGESIEALWNAGQTSRFEAVRRAALDLLPILEQRRRNEDAPKNLLRPSAANSAAILARPAPAAPRPDELLLRPPAT